jgi:hypothetical protein
MGLSVEIVSMVRQYSSQVECYFLPLARGYGLVAKHFPRALGTRLDPQHCTLGAVVGYRELHRL